MATKIAFFRSFFSFSFFFAGAFSLSQIGMDECGKSRACWAFPPDCDSSASCHGIMRWRFEKSHLRVELQAKPIVDPAEAQWMAIAFGDDRQMGNDTVLECVFGIASGNGTADAFISYNQFTQNIRLRSASQLMVKEKDFLQTEDRLGCAFTVDYGVKLSAADQKWVLRLDAPQQWWHVLFAQGPAERNSGQKQFHLLVQKSEQLVKVCEKCDDKYVVVER